MQDDLFIDEFGRFQMASEDLAAFIDFLRQNEVPCAIQDPTAFTTGGRSYGYGCLEHRYHADVAEELHRQWKSSQEQGQMGHEAQSR